MSDADIIYFADKKSDLLRRQTSDGGIKTISYPNNNNESTTTFGPIMSKMKDKIRMNSTVIDITNNIQTNWEQNNTVTKAKDCCSGINNVRKRFLAYIGFHNGRVAPIAPKIRERHLELEPLCCMSSCLVRGGCMTVVVFEITYIVLTMLSCSIKFYNGGRWKFWQEFEPNFNAFVTHQVFLYALIGFDILTALLVLILLRGLVSFDKDLVKRHWSFDFFALGFNVCAFVFYILGISSQGPETWSFDNILLIMCFAGQIILQLWAISVVRSCYEYFNLLRVFINLAEA
uniref:Uncharacterized protein n=1 Tax=Panagrellus redivivus TaxID=6233 RepID=A0A7E4V109_PANRE